MSTYAERRRDALDGAAAAARRRLDELGAELAALDPADPGTPAEQARLEAAIAALTSAAADVATEQALLAAAPAAELTDDVVERGLLAWLWGPPRARVGTLLAAAGADPVPRALGTTPLVWPPVATAVVGVLGRGRPTSVAPLRAAIGAAALEELVAAGLRTRLAQDPADRPALTRDVAVLLPLRLETLFRPAGADWTMLLRIVPDEPSVRRDDPVPTPTEIRLLTAMWQATYDALRPADRVLAPADWLSRDLVPTAWETFCAQVAPPRAAWLAGTFPPAVVADVVTVAAPAADHPAPPNRIGGFPRTVEVWASFGGDPELLATSTVDTAALEFDVLGGRAEPDGTVVEQADRWWVSWPEAVRVGLGLEIALPAGRGPADITVLYAVGLTEENPAEHFRAQLDAGELAYLPLGAPTNAVDGDQAASLGHAAADWRDTAAARLRGSVDGELGRWLTGTDAGFPPPPGTPSGPAVDQLLVRALWPALWGHHLRDVWRFGEEADRLAAWAADALRPEGPLPPVRIADQPYGLLPVAAMPRWRPAPEEGDAAACEGRLLEPLLALRGLAAAAARDRGTAVGADTERLLDLLGEDALAAGHAYRLLLPTELWAALYVATAGADPDRFAEQVRELFRPAQELLAQEPARFLLAAGDADPLTIPLVVPRTWPEFFWEPGRVDDDGNPVPAMTVPEGLVRLLGDLLREETFLLDQLRETWRRVLPDSLLVRLLLSSSLLATAGAARTNAGSADPLLEPVIGDTAVPTVLRALGRTWTAGDPDDHPAGFVRRVHRDGLEQLWKLLQDAPDRTAEVERAFRATLDTATHRVDPWLTGMAGRRLAYLSRQPDTRFRLGVYGWVDGPMLGAPGPTTGGLLHAPSHAQALTAVILRDKAVSERLLDPGGRDLWSMQLDSDRIRLVEELAEEVRLGAHLHEVVGRQVERVVATAAGVRALRAAFPMRTGQDEAGRVCSGVDALAALLSPVPPVPVSATQVTALTALRDALDAYGDLLVAEAVHQVVTGRADLAGAAMAAAAGLAGPPTLAFTETPLGGEGLTTAVVSALPFAAGAGTPAALADGSAAALLASTSPAGSWTWAAGGSVVTLAELGLAPVDTLVLSADLLADLAAHRLGAPPTGGTGPDLHRQARDLVRALGTQPALASDLASTGATDDSGEIAAQDAAILTELRGRYTALLALAQDTVTALTAAADDPARIDALRAALRWGVVPAAAAEPGDGAASPRAAYVAAILDGTVPADPALLLSLTAAAADALGTRLKAAPAVDAREPIGRSIAELAAPEGRLAVLAAHRLDSLLAVSGLTVDADPALDTDWLPVVAAVRPHLGRLEALQLEALVAGTPGFAPVSSAPGDHWRTAALAELVARRAAPGGNPRSSVPRFVAGYGLDGAWSAGPGATVAVGLVDSWSETVPRPRQTTTAAFGFNAPAARPPQAILLAVPADLAVGYGVPATTAGLVEVLADTRELARARAVPPGSVLPALPTTTLDGTGDTGVTLTGTSF